MLERQRQSISDGKIIVRAGAGYILRSFKLPIEILKNSHEPRSNHSTTQPSSDPPHAAITTTLPSTPSHEHPTPAPRALTPLLPGISLTAKSVEAGGGDLITIYNSGRFRTATPTPPRSSWRARCSPPCRARPSSRASARPTPSAACRASWPSRRRRAPRACGPSPPSASSMGGFRRRLEETSLGYGAEAEMVRLAREMDMLRAPCVFGPDEARRMARAGADVVVAHVGLRRRGERQKPGGVCGRRAGD